MQDLGQYSGVKTAKLSISNLNAANNNLLFRCLVKNASCEITSNSVLLSVGNTGLNQVKSGLEFSVFPNPANDFLNLQWSGKVNESTIFVTDPMGKLVMGNSILKNGEAIDIQHLDAGIYFLHLQLNETRTTLRFMKN
jgi:hypothetical protein